MSTENASDTSAPAIRYAAVTFDCPDPAELGRFYGDALGLPVVYSTDDFVLVGQEGSAGLGFNRLADYRRPTWPDPSQEKQAHIELGVDDLDVAQARLLALGAVEPPCSRNPTAGGSSWTPRVIRSASPPWSELHGDNWDQNLPDGSSRWAADSPLVSHLDRGCRRKRCARHQLT